MKLRSINAVLVLQIAFCISCQNEIPPFYPQVEFNSKPDSGNTTTFFELQGQLINESGDIEVFYRWDIDNDSAWDTDYSTASVLEHRFYYPGSYRVHMQILTSQGIDTSMTKTILVSQGYSAPRPDFKTLPDSGNFTTEFIFDSAITTDDEDSISTLEFRWDIFNDGYWETPWKKENLYSYKFSESGKFPVRLAAKDPSGQHEEIVKTVVVHNRDTLIHPMFKWSAENMRINETIEFDASMTFYEGMDPRGFHYQWKFPNDLFFSEKSTNPITEFVFSLPGDNVVSLLVTDQFGLSNQLVKEVRVDAENSPPIAEIGYASPYANIRTNFFFHTWNCSDDHMGSSLLEKRWDFNGDDNWDTPWQRKSEFHHQFDSPGKFLVRLEVRDDGYNTDTDEKLVTISEFSNPTDYFVDSRDGQYYSTVKVGAMWWMAENLKYQVPKKQLEGGLKPFQYFRENEETIEDYGVFYNIGTSIENRNDEQEYRICPHGWRIPSKEDWESLFNEIYPNNPGEALVWGGAEDFNATHTGYIDWSISQRDTIWTFKETNQVGWFLSSTQHPDYQRTDVYVVRLIRESSELWVGYNYTKYYIPVRCVKD